MPARKYTIRRILSALYAAYWHMGYREFCNVLEFNPKHDEHYFISFQNGVRSLNTLTSENLEKLIEWGLKHLQDEGQFSNQETRQESGD